MKRILFCTSGLLLLPALAQAGAWNEESGLYKSNLGYQITLPANWLRIDNATAAAMKSSLPKNLTADALSRFDAIFFPNYITKGDLKNPLTLKADNARIALNNERVKNDPLTQPDELDPPIGRIGGANAEIPEFSPTVSIIVTKAAPRQSPEAPKLYQQQIVKDIQENPNIKGFKVVNATQNNALPSGNAYLFNVEYSASGRSLAAEQHVIFHNQQTVIVTCTDEIDAYVKDKNWCGAIVSTLKFVD